VHWPAVAKPQTPLVFDRCTDGADVVLATSSPTISFTPQVTCHMIENLRKVVIIVAIVNLAYFGIEFAVAAAIRSVSLFADSIDFLEDASVNLLIAIALSWSASSRARLGMVLAGILLIPALATLWTAWGKVLAPMPPAPLPLSLTALGALGINLSCAFMLARFRAHSGSLTRAAFLSARNDTVANLAIIAAGSVTAYTHSAWPDLFVGLGIAAMNVDAAREVWRAAREEHRAAPFGPISS
jgi:Co/Zn/Cd efflux system component